MIYLVYFLCGITICAIVFSIIGFCYWRYASNKKIQQYKQEEYQKEKEKVYKKIKEETFNANEKLIKINSEILEKTQFNNSLLQMREEELNRLIEAKREAAESTLSHELAEWECSAQEAATFAAEQIRKNLDKEINIEQNSLEQLKKEIEEYRSKREVINQEILRSRAIEEQQDFYRIQLDDFSKQDIEVLNNVRQKLNKTDLLNKLIYENYIARPVKEMIKRVLEGKNPSGIYKVTNIKTGEIYIGKSVKTADRFSNHVKSAYGLEGVAESQFQRALKKYGVDNFTWELLEEVSKDNLSEAEKKWIEFYGTKEFGYNQRLG